MDDSPETAYHHGNLRADLVSTGLRLARSRGSSALVARELAREVGVTSAAVYRHFPDLDHLKAAVAQAAREEMARSMIRARDKVPGGRTKAARGVARLLATGSAYIQFAIDEPELFETAFMPCRVSARAQDDPSGWGVLNEALDDLVSIGALDPQRRAGAALIAWTSVHGLASLVAHGALPGPPVEVARATVLAGVLRALSLEA